MVALSVSISANISPSSTLSPTFFSHEATVPSSMVSLKRGMFTTIAILITYALKMDNLFLRTQHHTSLIFQETVTTLRMLHIL